MIRIQKISSKNFLPKFLTAASCPKKDFYTPPPPKKKQNKKNMQQTFVLHTQNSTSFVLSTQKSVHKSRQKKSAKKVAKKAAKRWQISSKKGGKKVCIKTH